MLRRPHCPWAKPERSSIRTPSLRLGENLGLSLSILPASLACICAHYHNGSHTSAFLALVLWERVRGSEEGRGAGERSRILLFPRGTNLFSSSSQAQKVAQLFCPVSTHSAILPNSAVPICSSVSLNNCPFTPDCSTRSGQQWAWAEGMAPGDPTLAEILVIFLPFTPKSGLFQRVDTGPHLQRTAPCYTGPVSL